MEGEPGGQTEVALCLPEMSLAMVLVGTNKVRSTPCSSAAFSCSSEEGTGMGGGKDSIHWH